MFEDEHRVTIAADVDDVWPALLDTLDGAFSRGGATAYARVVGCVPWRASGPRPLDVGSTIPGFRVAAAEPGHELVLEGRHRFSTYTLTFCLERVAAGRSQVRARTRAAFPGALGALYRLLVIGTGGHVVVTRRLLAGVRHRSEKHARARS